MLPPLKSIPEIAETDLFAASYVKLARAQKFIDEVEAELARYIADEPTTGFLDHSANPPAISIHWKGITLLPGAIAGDAIHNLRTSLDLMASELARLNGQPDADVYFPFAASADKFEGVIKSRNFDRAGDDAVALLRTFAPYRGGNELLRALHDLVIQDKHKTLVPTGSAMSFQVQAQYNIDDLTQNQVAVTPLNVRYGFPDGGILGGRNLVETLKDSMQLTHGIVEAFAALVRKRTSTCGRASPSGADSV